MIDSRLGLNEPFLLIPVGKDYLWGGRRLRDEYNKDCDLEPLAETWECSTHPDGVSLVASGAYKGSTLKEVLEKHPEYLGVMHKECVDGQLPILIKYIDASKNLSVQVHPDDEYARENENGQLGKTEMWYVIDAKKDAELIYGFHHDVTKSQVEAAVSNGNIEKYLQKVPVKKDDLFFIEPGQVHAIGEGVVVAEIQECSNLTYRLYDYDRTDKHGNKRQLHLEKALDVANLSESKAPRQPMRCMSFFNGYAIELLCRCKYFQVQRMLLNTERCRNMAAFEANKDSATIMMCIDGCGSLISENGPIHFVKGDTVFLPATMGESKLHGRAQLLVVTY
ncbi:MAG: class I mannose-6-phosphate isomerase [Bacteroidaceae bacterium]|nr:class I mannose-6-phosphate isomerase [Bacteroidaceae bacterium]